LRALPHEVVDRPAEIDLDRSPECPHAPTLAGGRGALFAQPQTSRAESRFSAKPAFVPSLLQRKEPSLATADIRGTYREGNGP
jgi:hypothetical protein